MSWAERIDEALDRLTRAQWVPQLLVRLFVGYGDPRANEIGTIYQSLSFTYLGQDYGLPGCFSIPRPATPFTHWRIDIPGTSACSSAMPRKRGSGGMPPGRGAPESTGPTYRRRSP